MIKRTQPGLTQHFPSALSHLYACGYMPAFITNKYVCNWLKVQLSRCSLQRQHIVSVQLGLVAMYLYEESFLNSLIHILAIWVFLMYYYLWVFFMYQASCICVNLMYCSTHSTRYIVHGVLLVYIKWSLYIYIYTVSYVLVIVWLRDEGRRLRVLWHHAVPIFARRHEQPDKCTKTAILWFCFVALTVAQFGD